MNKKEFIDEVERELKIIFSSIKLNKQAPSQEKFRCEGFMKAGIFLGVVSQAELTDLMEKVHFDVFGQTIVERKELRQGSWKSEVQDYSLYEVPTFLRPER